MVIVLPGSLVAAGKGLRQRPTEITSGNVLNLNRQQLMCLANCTIFVSLSVIPSFVLCMKRALGDRGSTSRFHILERLRGKKFKKKTHVHIL